MDKSEYLKDIRYLVSRPEFEALPDEEIKWLYEVIRKRVSRDNKFPVYQTVRFICRLNGPLCEDGFRATVEMLDPNYPLLSKMDLDWIMDHYGVHGSVRFVFPRDREAFLRGELRSCDIIVYRPGSPLAPSGPLQELRPRQARMLNLKAEGKTQKKISEIEGCSISTVSSHLHQVIWRASCYGFWQIWPKSVKMKFTDTQYVKALVSRGKPERTDTVGKE